MKIVSCWLNYNLREHNKPLKIHITTFALKSFHPYTLVLINFF